MSAYIVYEGATGRILRSGTASEAQAGLQADPSAGERLLLEMTADDMTQYIDVVAGQVLDRAPMAAIIDKTTLVAEGADTCTITQIAAGVMARVEGGDTFADVVITDHVLLLDVDSPGVYRVTLSGFPYLTQSFEITAT